mmetsp:Transcript_31613/g.73740  ORF Transcript_31613/g.73740 Transcript_31613/m.73740 type:complete len:120 (+) Transcript_31613:1655-2014(+)
MCWCLYVQQLCALYYLYTSIVLSKRVLQELHCLRRSTFHRNMIVWDQAEEVWTFQLGQEEVDGSVQQPCNFSICSGHLYGVQGEIELLDHSLVARLELSTTVVTLQQRLQDLSQLLYLH